MLFQAESGSLMASSYRKFIVKSVVQESDSAKSFILVPEDGGRLEPYLPGQHLPLRLHIPGQGRPVVRCYTLSDCFNERHYRLTIKKELAPANRPEIPPGQSSSYFHETLRIGDSVEARPPSGNFYLDPQQAYPVALLAGGIGVTPMISMINAVRQWGSRREVHFIFALRHGGDHVFKEHLRAVMADCPNILMHVLYENPRQQDVLGVDYHRVGRIDLPTLRVILPSLNLEYYVCGPSAMMDAISTILTAEGISSRRIRTESFGPSSLSFRAATAAEVAEYDAQPSQVPVVTFARSGKTALWSEEANTLLEFAEAHGVDISFGCRYGDCGTCMTRLIRGTVEYLHPTGASPDPGCCLPCSCKPETDVVLDA
jgi:ferredoxin-NADP reductase